MCGIAGELRFDSRPPDLQALDAMTGCLEARGPDGHGMVVRDHVAFAHRRLKIIDLSEAAQQPMVDPHLGLGIVYNGALYNYRALKQELEGVGYRFFSTGDTEVILKAYHAWGEGCFERFNGMFALAIHERERGRVVLARDRLGIKPLYFAPVPGGLRFASTLPALLKGGEVDTEIDPVALNYYMTFHSVVPPPHTILQGVRKLPPATVATIESDGTRRDRTFWSLRFDQGPEADHSEAEWREAVLDGLRRSVARRMLADVPVGVLLSGGLDSSLIVGLLCEQGDPAEIDTFSIGFETVGDEEGDEFRYSDQLAAHFGTRHHKLFIRSDRALPALRECVAAMSEPMVSHDNVAFYLLAQEVAKHVKVVQSGQGADEIFAGYHWYPTMMKSRNPVADYARVFFDRDPDELRRAVHPRFHGQHAAWDYVESHFARPGAPRPIDKALRLDTEVMLVDDPVKRVDNHTMAAGLEARVPFLDHELVELAASVPPELKAAHGGKYILKEAARQVVPKAVIDRPKGYFPVPALKYLQGEFLELARGLLTGPRARERGLFQRDYVETVLEAPDAHLTPLRGSKLWQMALLEFWLQTHGV